MVGFKFGVTRKNRKIAKLKSYPKFLLIWYLINAHHTLETLTVCMSRCYHLLYSL